MKLSKKLEQLHDELTEGTLSAMEINDAFVRCIEDAEYYEDIEKDIEKVTKFLNTVTK